MSPSKHGVKFGRVASTISVKNVDRALAFYVDILGFQKTFENGNPVGFLILKKDSAEIHITKNPNHSASTQNVAHLLVEDAESLYRHLESKKVRIIKGIRDAKFGLRTFVMADPDGNRIDVGQPI